MNNNSNKSKQEGDSKDEGNFLENQNLISQGSGNGTSQYFAHQNLYGQLPLSYSPLITPPFFSPGSYYNVSPFSPGYSYPLSHITPQFQARINNNNRHGDFELGKLSLSDTKVRNQANQQESQQLQESQKSQSAPEVIEQGRNIYIRRLPPSTSDESLKILCSKFGKVVSAKAILEQHPLRLKTGELTTTKGACKGFGFALFECFQEAQNAIIGLNSIGYQASFAKESLSKKLKSLADEQSTNVYVSNIPLTLSDDDFMLLGKKFGNVVSSKILRDSLKFSRGVGFIRYKTRQEAQDSINGLIGLMLEDSTVPLQARFADNDQQKKVKTSGHARKNAQFAQNDILLFPTPPYNG